VSSSPASHPRTSRRRRAKVVATAAACLTAAGAVWLTAGTANAGTVSGSLYRDPNNSAARWVAANSNDSRAQAIRDKIASQSTAYWVANFNISGVRSDVSSYVGKANAAGQIPVLSVYGITNRDCGGASAGGAPDLNQYQTWISNLAQGLGSQTVLIILETDSLALQTCLSAGDVTARANALHNAVRTLKAANRNAKVYLDGGHSTWNSASEQAGRLIGAGIADADGFFTNVSNFNPTSGEANFGHNLTNALASRGVPNKHQIIDTSRNGGASGDWCGDDNTDRRIGHYPTTDTGDSNIDGYLWVKPPGEADGCKYAAGSFQPDLAFSLANGVPNPPVTQTSSPPVVRDTTPPPSSPSTRPSSPSAPVSASPSASDPGVPSTGSCSASYRVDSTWQGGFQGTVTVTAGSSAISGWTVTWVLPSGQSISQAWNATLTTSGSTVTAHNVGWNGPLGARASTTFGFIGSGSSAGAPTLTCA
jgi:endoglucanase